MNKRKYLLGLFFISIFLMGLLFPRYFMMDTVNEFKASKYQTNTTSPISNEFTEEVLSKVRTGEVNKDFIYLSDIDYIADQSRVSWGTIMKDGAANGAKISVKVENSFYPFDKGMWAHATSTLVYDLSSYNYKYFTAYIGLNSSAASFSNGVKFYIYTSVDGVEWILKTEENPTPKKAGENATFVKINLDGAKYLKLYANDNGHNGSDHAVYADAKLTNLEEEENVFNLEEIDRQIKNYGTVDLTNEAYEKLILQRYLIKNIGGYALKRFLNESPDNLETFNWLYNDLENLRFYVIGGTPDGGSFYNSLKQLTRLYKAYHNDFDITETTSYGTVLGTLYKKMAITLSLTHASTVGLWMNSGMPTNTSDAVVRYEIYKKLHKNGKFVVSARQDHTKWYEQLHIEELRFVLSNGIDDEEILWLNEYTQKRIDAHPNQEETYLQPHTYISYVYPNYNNPIFHDPDKKSFWDETFGGIFSKYGVTYSTPEQKVVKVWMNLRNSLEQTGAVCGGISKTGSNIRAVHGTPSSVISQPGHAAIIYYRKNSEGKGYWNIDNDVFGWAQSGRTERLNLRMPLGWGNEEYIDFHADWLGMATYVLIAQGALNDFENYQTSKELMLVSEVYSGDQTKLYQLYRDALNSQPLNIDAWYGLIKTYRSDSTKTEVDFYNLGKEIMTTLKYYPLPMYHLVREIQKELTDPTYVFKYNIDLKSTLTEAKGATDAVTIQRQAVVQESTYLLGQTNTTLATFSFDGDNAGNIVLSDRFNDTGLRFDYSLDGKNTWTEVSFSADEEHKLALTKQELASITADNDIYVHIIGTDYSEENLYKIDILSQPTTNLYGNDLENQIIGINNSYEWRFVGNDAWTSYQSSVPDLTGNKEIEVRIKASGTKLPSAIQSYTFTDDAQLDTRKYVPISHLSIHTVSTEATSNGGNAIYAIDGNINTRWHSAWNGTDTRKFIVVKFDKIVNLSAVEYLPLDGGNGKILEAQVLGSMDGENFEELGTATWANNGDLKNIEFDESKEVQYVKIVGTRTAAAYAGGNFIGAKMFNFYQDLTKNPHPTAGISFSTTNPTNKEVVATLTNLSSPTIEITSEGGNTHTFTENGTFEFTFRDTVTNIEGNAIANVTWIDKTAPTASIRYSTTKETTGPVIVSLVDSSENIEVINRVQEQNDTSEKDENFDPFTYVFLKNGEFTFKFKDRAGNIGSVKATVDWIRENKEKPVPIITYSKTDPTNEDVTATITFKGNAVIANNKGLNTYTFEENGEFTFRYQDNSGNISEVKAEVNNIDKIPPTATLMYDITEPTKEKVTARILSVSEKIVPLTGYEHTFTENGTYEFKFKDLAGNEGTAVATVNWIEKPTTNEPNKEDNTDTNTNNNHWVPVSKPQKPQTNTNTITKKPTETREPIKENESNIEESTTENNTNSITNNKPTTSTTPTEDKKPNKEETKTENKQKEDAINKVENKQKKVWWFLIVMGVFTLIAFLRIMIQRKRNLKKAYMD